MVLKVYKLDASPLSRAVMTLLDYLKVKYEPIDVNVFNNEHLLPEFVKKNPFHAVPVLEDGDVTVIDSHAILMYVAETYGKDDSLYPKNPKERAMVNQILFFNSGMIFVRMRNVTIPTIMERTMTSLDEKRARAIVEVYEFLEALLTRTKYIARDHLTIADFSCAPGIDSLNVLVPLDKNKFPKSHAWLMEMAKLPAYQKHIGGLRMIEQAVAAQWTA